MKRKYFKTPAKLTVLLLSLLMAFSINLAGCSREDAGEAVELALTALNTALEDAGTPEDCRQEYLPPSGQQNISGETDSDSSQQSHSIQPQEIPAISSSPASAESRTPPRQDSEAAPSQTVLSEDGWYSSKEEVALYLYTYGKLPGNYLTKKDASSLGWDSAKGNLWEVAPGMSIGGDVFGNREGLLPKADGRSWYECDIDYEGGYRGAKRILYSSDGLIYYTEDHYQSFELLYSSFF